MLLFILITLAVSILFLILTDETNLEQLRFISLFSSSIVLILSCLIASKFDFNVYYFQEVISFDFGGLLDLNYSFGLDGISLFFFFLSSLLIFSCLLFIWEEKKLYKEYALNLLVIELFLLVIFSVLDLFLFYIFFEAILIPMYIIIGV